MQYVNNMFIFRNYYNNTVYDINNYINNLKLNKYNL